ncbi:putative protein OS=Streptomyces aurantiogriseus OX=66870 GN=GCM10010251_58750 PE=4 SV=1 [Streptomyces aurantiogriseus]|uniref:Uncharacterized protein n=1 Tax=Streptomyces aurantiogriseus TaxID=66870 RepID=A0A918KV50_9ACTN|nr:hypothetical protein GCM10010251_58750 [Streptomyces aurantiogriseus]
MEDAGATASRDARRHELHFPPLRNGADYLVSVVDHLTKDEVGPRDLKYAVLHLQAAIEVLLKERLSREHWTLVFSDPGQASFRRFHEGDFESCTTKQAVQRLRSIVGCDITDDERSALIALAADRNALQHYGLTQNAHAVEARAGRVLDFLYRFIHTELINPTIGTPDERLSYELNYVITGVRSIDAFVKQRMRRLRGDLKGHEPRTIDCPSCGQNALVLAASQPRHRCFFCEMHFHRAEIMRFILTRRERGFRRECPRCQDHALIDGLRVASESASAPVCFTCNCVVPEARDILIEEPEEREM